MMLIHCSIEFQYHYFGSIYARVSLPIFIDLHYDYEFYSSLVCSWSAKENFLPWNQNNMQCLMYIPPYLLQLAATCTKMVYYSELLIQAATHLFYIHASLN